MDEPTQRKMHTSNLDPALPILNVGHLDVFLFSAVSCNVGVMESRIWKMTVLLLVVFLVRMTAASVSMQKKFTLKTN